MATNKRKYWGELSLKERAQFYPYYIAQGITSPKEIGEAYDNDLETEENNIYSGTDEDTQLMNIDNSGNLIDLVHPATYVDLERQEEEKRRPWRRSIRDLAYNTAYGVPGGIAGGYNDYTQISSDRGRRKFEKYYNRAIQQKAQEDRELELLTKNRDRTITPEEFGELQRIGTNKVAPYIGGTLAASFALPSILSSGVAISQIPAFMRAVDIVGNIDGMRNLLSNEGINKTINKVKQKDVLGALKSGLGDTLDLVGVGDTVRLGTKLANKAYRAYHAFNAIEPFDYRNMGKKSGKWLKSMLLENDYVSPAWRKSEDVQDYYDTIKTAFGEDKANLAMKAREDAWALYTGQPQKYNTYIKNADGTYSYNIEIFRDHYKNHPEDLIDDIKATVYNKHDFMGLTHGGLWSANTDTIYKYPDLNSTSFNNLHIEDLWDLQPFQRASHSFSGRVKNSLTEALGTQAWRNRADKFRTFMYDKGLWGNNSKFSKITYPIDRTLNRFRSGIGYKLVEDAKADPFAGFVLKDAPKGFHWESYELPKRMDDIIEKISKNKLTSAIDKKLKDIEVSKLIGGNPFYMKTDIPFTKTRPFLPYSTSIGYIGYNAPLGYNNVMKSPALLNPLSITGNRLSLGGNLYDGETENSQQLETINNTPINWELPYIRFKNNTTIQPQTSTFKRTDLSRYPKVYKEVFARNYPEETRDINYSLTNKPAITFEEYTAERDKNSIIDSAVERIKRVENSKNNPKGGYNAETDRWYPHKSVEGGSDTVAWGFKLGNNPTVDSLITSQGYLTGSQADSLLRARVNKDALKASAVYDKKFGNGEWSKLSNEAQSILTDYQFNPGISSFPKLMKAFYDDDIEEIYKQFKRYTGGKPLGRNKVIEEELEKFRTGEKTIKRKQ